MSFQVAFYSISTVLLVNKPSWQVERAYYREIKFVPVNLRLYTYPPHWSPNQNII
jgi:hypothetical protein